MTSRRFWARLNGWQRYVRRWPKPSRGRRRAHQKGSPMLQVSDIQSSQEELQEYYAQLRAQHVTPAWIGGGITQEPQSEALPYLWHWRDLRPQAMRAAELVGTAQAERRVLRLSNPKLSGVASNTLVANIQIVMPGEIARPHHHAGAAQRVSLAGRGGYTVGNAERVQMS